MNKSIASTQGQKNKRYSVKKPSIAHFFVSQSRLTDAVSVIFGELLSYEHPPNAGGLLLHSICLRLKSVAQLAPLRLVCKNTPCLQAIRSLLEMGIHVLIVLIEIHFILVGIAEALDGEAVELDDIPVLQHARHQRDAAADIAHIPP